MLQLQKVLVNRSILSLRTGGTIGMAMSPIINPNNLKIEGFYATDRFTKGEMILLSQDIRDFLPQGFVVDDHDVLTSPDELIRLKEVLELRFELINKPVFTDSKKRLGKINDYAVEIETLYIQKLYVSQTLLKSLTGGQLSVDRNQVVEITNSKVIILDPLQPTKARPETVPLAS